MLFESVVISYQESGTMLKEYFTDGLIRIALIISLLRVNMNPRDLLDRNPDIEELLQGPTSAYTQARFHHQNWNQDIGAFIHPKHVDNGIDDLLHDLHALGRFRNNHALNTVIDAYLVNDPEPPNLAQEATSDNNNNERTQNNGTATTAQGPGTGEGELQIKKEDPEPIGADPTKEVLCVFDTFHVLRCTYFNIHKSQHYTNPRIWRCVL